MLLTEQVFDGPHGSRPQSLQEQWDLFYNAEILIGVFPHHIQPIPLHHDFLVILEQLLTLTLVSCSNDMLMMLWMWFIQVHTGQP